MDRVRYKDLNPRQQENYNTAKFAAVLADYGYHCMRLSDDWHGADLIAHHIDGHDLLVQVKSRLNIRPSYRGKNLWMAFPHDGEWYLFPHDPIQNEITARNPKAEDYSWRHTPKWALTMLEPYRLEGEE